MIVRKYVLPAAAAFGLFMALRTVVSSSTPRPEAIPLAEPAHAPYEKVIAGAGIIESSSENVSIASPVGGVVATVGVRVGDRVKRGDPLFSLDTRHLEAELRVKEAALEIAKVERAEAEDQYSRWQALSDKRAVSEDEMSKRRFRAEASRSRLEQAQGEVDAAKAEIERHTIRAPLDAQVLQARIRPGEFAPAQATISPLMLLGDTATLHVRTDIDENDAWRVRAGAPGTAILRANNEVSMKLEFVRFEPYVIPKRALTGESTERVDTRVLQVVYRIIEPPAHLFVGQLVDVFIEDVR